MRAGIDANTTEARKLEINRTLATDFHKARISPEGMRGPSNIAQRKDQTNIHQTRQALSISPAIAIHCWTYPGSEKELTP